MGEQTEIQIVNGVEWEQKFVVNNGAIVKEEPDTWGNVYDSYFEAVKEEPAHSPQTEHCNEHVNNLATIPDYVSDFGHNLYSNIKLESPEADENFSAYCPQTLVVLAIETTEKAKKLYYRKCVVPKCKNNTNCAPDKIFFLIPKCAKIQKQWCKIMRKKDKPLSPKSSAYCCEDHFNVKEDTSNYCQYNIMKQQGEKVTLRLKKGVLPHIFHCQKRNMPAPVVRLGAMKRERLALINEALSEDAGKSREQQAKALKPRTSHRRRNQ